MQRVLDGQSLQLVTREDEIHHREQPLRNVQPSCGVLENRKLIL